MTGLTYESDLLDPLKVNMAKLYGWLNKLEYGSYNFKWGKIEFKYEEDAIMCKLRFGI